MKRVQVSVFCEIQRRFIESELPKDFPAPTVEDWYGEFATDQLDYLLIGTDDNDEDDQPEPKIFMFFDVETDEQVELIKQKAASSELTLSLDFPSAGGYEITLTPLVVVTGLVD